MTSETSGNEATESSAGDSQPIAAVTESAPPTSEASMPTQTGVQAEGKRTQLRRVRDDVQSLSKDVGDFRKGHEMSSKKLESLITKLRSELAAQSLSKDVGNLKKSHDASSKRLEKQVATLRAELASLKSGIAKDAARSRAKQDATLAKILAKVSVKPKAAAPSKPVKKSKKR